ncbi:unnamed protein product [Brassica rapa]|uniref:Uncharacterized protein n=2 Tax=Brassica TaxID=3705 RepID=A0A8D9LS52_BRACM|nr:unnamed protein product [Brassica napus]CAG7884813.1 unnamed protein product [Brassica rapa]
MVSSICESHQLLPVANFAINAGAESADHPRDDKHVAVKLSVE